MGMVEEVELGTGLRDNYERAPWLLWNWCLNTNGLKGKQGQMLEKGYDFVGLLPKCSFFFDWFTGIALEKVTKNFCETVENKTLQTLAIIIIIVLETLMERFQRCKA